MTQLIFGTANIGLAYGKALSRPMFDETQAEKLLDSIERSGFSAVDTAAAYGQAERRIGQFFSTHNPNGLAIHTKISPTVTRGDQLSVALQTSLELLQAAPKQILLHRWQQRFWDDGAIWDGLRYARDCGQCERIGASVQSPQEALQALKDPDVEVIQLACNVLDWRFDSQPMREAFAKSAAKIEVRSVFLQGLLTLHANIQWPVIDVAYDSENIADFLRDQATIWAGGDLIQLCLRYIISLDWVDALVIGADDPAQVAHIGTLANCPVYSAAEVALINAARPLVPEALLDPSKWC